MTAKITLLQDDITQLAVDAVVNAANSQLQGGGGVDGAIHRAAGPQLASACREIGGCQTGKAVVTPAFDMPAKCIIHTVGPIWAGGERDEAALLASCYRSTLDVAQQNGLRTVAFPAISCGVYGYPVSEACRISVEVITEEIARHADIRKVILCAYDDVVYQQWLNALSGISAH